MLVTALKTAEDNDYLNERMKKAFSFLRDTDLQALPCGRHDIDGDLVFANVMEYDTVPADQKDLEAHRLYYDVQYVVEGHEALYYAPLEGLAEASAFNEQDDFGLYKTPAFASCIYMKAGELVIAAPEDAHKPGCCIDEPCHVKKVVVKVSAQR